MPVASYAAGKKALGLCDRCGFQYLLSTLQYEIQDQRLNGLRVCLKCLDKDQEQLRLGDIVISDPESLYDPRPDIGEVASTSYFGWRPVGHPLTSRSQTAVGTVTVVIT